VLVFFVGAACGWWSVGWAWLCALGAVAGASIWGWISLETDLRRRLRGMVFKAVIHA
jgi:hypothetical protein